MITATKRESIENFYVARQRDDDMKRLSEAAGPLVEAWGYEKYCAWVDEFVTESMTTDQMITEMNRWHPAERVPQCYGLPD